jgi:hypothetical protein
MLRGGICSTHGGAGAAHPICSAIQVSRTAIRSDTASIGQAWRAIAAKGDLRTSSAFHAAP